MKIDDSKRDAWRSIQDRAERLKALYGARDTMAEELRKMYHFEWSNRPDADWIKPTMSPTAYNAITGAARLLTSTDPQFNVSSRTGDDAARATADKLEAAAKVMWTSSGEITGIPLHYEMVRSSLIGAEVVAYMTRTADIVEYAQGTKNKGLIARAKEAQALTPYMFNAYNPANCYTERDMLGVSAVMRRERVTWGDVLTLYGQFAKDVMPASAKLDTLVEITEWYDHEWRAVWVQGAEPILFIENPTPFLPVVSNITDGSLLWREPERQRSPFLYALLKSGLWQRENLMLTVIYSLVHGIGSNPLLVWETENGEQLEIDYSVPGRAIKINKGDRLSPLIEKVLDPSQMQGWQLAQQLNEASTIPAVALGAAPAGGMPFSAISLLTQSGRLPLIGTRQGVGNAAATLVRRALQWMKSSKDGELYDNQTGMEIGLAPEEIPDRVPVECVLEVDLPQDKLQLANAALGLKNGGLAPTSWIQENVLGIGQTTRMQREMLDEQMQAFMVQRFMEQTKAKDQQTMQQMQQAQMQAAADSMAAGVERQVPNTRPMTPEVNGRGGQPAQVAATDGTYPPGGVQAGAPLAGPLPAQGMA